MLQLARRIALTGAVLAVGWAALGCSPPPALVVDLRTDLTPGFEFASAHLEVRDGAGAVVGAAEHFAGSGDYVAGVRIGELLELGAGEYVVRVGLRMADGRQVVAREILVDLRGALAVTAVLTRDCQDVVCPGVGEAALSECLGAVCVDPRCSPETPEHCPAPACASDADCGSGSVCAPGRCEGGVCLYAATPGGCGAGLSCDVDVGCVPDARCDVMGGCSLVSALAGGWEHNCARFTDGRVACWGADGRDLGAGNVPTYVLGIGPSAQLASGWGLTCSLDVDANVDCFGRVPLAPGGGVVRYPELAGARQLVAARSVACAVLADGSARCWGSNSAGQLGDGTRDASASPQLVYGSDTAPFVSLAAGIEHLCGINVEGGVRCWGQGNFGQLGDGSTGRASEWPVDVEGVDDAVQLSLGFTHTCARRADGRVACWGYGTGGQLGIGDVPTGYAFPEPQDVLEIDDAVDLASGQTFTCALRASGEVWCWGSAGVPLTDRPEPLPGFTDVVDIAGHGFGVCGRRRDGEVICRGMNWDGELGDGTNQQRDLPVSVLAPVAP